MSKTESAILILRSVIKDTADSFPDNTVSNVQELIEHNEPGVALEILCAQLREFQVLISPEVEKQIHTAASLMEISLTDF